MTTNRTYHILNGDSLLARFPKSIPGTQIVCRECLVDGNIKGITLEELYKNRIVFLNKQYGGVSKEKYYLNTVSQFEMILNIPQENNTYLWFEDDVFCQINFWFITSLLVRNEKLNRNIFLVRPQLHAPYSFGHHSNEQLLEIHSNPINITQDILVIASLWDMYANNNLSTLYKTAGELKGRYPFIYNATIALIESIPTSTSLGRPKDSLIALKKKLNTNDFSELFMAFSEQEAIYGFGDLQVLRLLKEIE